MSKSKLRFACLLTLVALTSCSATASYVYYPSPELARGPFSSVEEQGYYKPKAFETLSCLDQEEIDVSFGNIYSYGSQRHVIESVDRPYLTVIPVDFVDYPSTNIDKDAIKNIQKAFFGDKSGNSYYSVREFYDKSSFHRLQLEGEVVKSFFRPTYTMKTLSNYNNANRTSDALKRMYGEAIAWYNSLDLGRTLEEGDPVYFVYSAPYATGKAQRSNMFWAFVINTPAPIGWSSYAMLNVSGSGYVDAHTCIHECGHLFGLDDYYDTEFMADPSPVSPLGRFDMMDCSLGDHSPFSKMAMGWNTPYVVTDDCEITIRQSEGNGDFILLSRDWNGTPFDEYIVMEYYSPSYLNAFDSKLEYGSGGVLLNGSGLKVYHVDARLGIYEDRNKKPVELFSEESTLGNHSLAPYFNNSGYESGGQVLGSRGGFLNQLLDASSGSDKLIPNFVASTVNGKVMYEGSELTFRDCLFKVGDGFNGNGFTDFHFHDGTTLPFGFEVTSMTTTEAKVRFWKKGFKLVEE